MMRTRALAASVAVAVALAIAYPLGFALHSVTAQTPQDRLIVSGERIGQMRLADMYRPSVIQTFFGQTIRTVGAPGWPLGAVEYQFFKQHGISIIADRDTGNILDVEITRRDSNRWQGYATAEGLGLGSTEEQVLTAMGPPTQTRGLSYPDGKRGRSLFYLPKGIGFNVYVDGPEAGRVVDAEIFWKVGTPGDTLIVPGERISAATLEAPLEETIRTVGGGFARYRTGQTTFYIWGHYGLTLLTTGSRVEEVVASPNVPWGWLDDSVRYATAEGLGLNSRAEDITSRLGEPPSRLRRGSVEWWAYPTLGLRVLLEERSKRVSDMSVIRRQGP